MVQNRVAIIGAGIVGVSTALWLQRKGFDVTLIDREGVASGTSFGNAGILETSGVVPVTVPGLIWKAPKMLFSAHQPLFLRWSYLPKLMPFLMRYLAHGNMKDLKHISTNLGEMIHDGYEQHLQLAKDTPAERYLKDTDYLYAYDTRAEYEADRLTWETRRNVGIPFQEMDVDQIATEDPSLAGKFEIAIKAGNHGQVTDPGEYTKALAYIFEKNGGTLLIAEVNDFIMEGNVVRALATSQGHVEADKIVLASGAWSKTLSEKLGAKIHMESERGYHIEFVNSNIKLNHTVMVTTKKFAMNAMEGRLRCGGIVEFGGLEAGPSRAPIELLKQQVKSFFPDLRYDKINTWLGHRPSTTDSLPLIGKFENTANVWAGFGHQHLGLTSGPKTGLWLAQMISGETPNSDLSAFSPDRF